MKVPWVVGRKRAIARAMAISSITDQGQHWTKLSQARRDAHVDLMERRLTEWVQSGLLATFSHEYREHNQQAPLTDWQHKR